MSMVEPTNGRLPGDLPDAAVRESVLIITRDLDEGGRLAGLLGSGYPVHVVSQDEAGSVAGVAGPYDLLIADSTDAVSPALALVAEWAAAGLRGDLPVLLLVEPGHEAEALETLRYGVTDFLSKPVSAPQLESRVDVLLELARLRDAVRLDQGAQRFRLFADSLALLMWLGDANGRCVDVNQAWLDYTGFTREQARGLGWLDALHPADRDRTLASFQRSFESQAPVELEYRLRQKDRSYGWMLDRGSPRYSPSGEFAGYVGWCSDITRHRTSEQRLRRVQALTAALSRALTPNQVASATVDYGMRAVGASAAWLARVDADDRTLTLLQSGGTQPKLWPRLAGQPLVDVPALERAVATGEPVFLESEAAIRTELSVADIDVPGALAVLPVLIDSSEPGCLGLCLPDERNFLESEKEDARMVARLAEQALARASRYATERRVARTLQRNLLPHHLPDIDGVASAARYLPGTGDIEVGGDWYQVLKLPANRIGVVVGDVAGHGIQAAATMGILRNALNAYLLEGHDPVEALDRSSRLLEHADERTLATAFCGVLDRGTRVFEYSTAGHPPPVLRLPDGSVHFLDAPKRVPLGLPPAEPRAPGFAQLPVGSVLIGYTDGLIERRSESLDVGLARLVECVAKAPGDVDALSDYLLEQLTGVDHDDDIALLALMLNRRASVNVSVEAVSTNLSGIRKTVGSWLEEHDVPKPEIQDVLLAVGEACANVVLHAYPDTPPDQPNGDFGNGRLQLTARLDGAVLQVRVRDFGSWRASGREFGGRGIPIMQKIMDTVDILPSDGGTTLEMQRRLTIGQSR